MADINYVTGASGFLGSHLAEKLENVVKIPHEEIKDFKLQPFSNFYFLSSYGNLFDQQDEEKIIQANLIDVAQIAKQLSKFSFNSFVFVSTSSVDLPRQTLYSRTKNASEALLMGVMERNNLPICIVRPFSITGVGEQPQHLIPTLIRSCMTGEHVDFVPEPTHDFVDVDDVVQSILHLSETKSQGITSVGNGKAYSNQEVLDLVEKTTEKKANITVVKSLRPYDTSSWFCSSPYRFDNLTPKPLEVSIQEMVQNYGRS